MATQEARSLIRVTGERDVVAASESGRRLARDVGFDGPDQVLIATAISEVARNIVRHAGEGAMEISTIDERGRHGIEVIARDEGPGIADVKMAMRESGRTGAGLGIGLPGSKRVMDEFAIDSALGQGTTVTMRKWVR